MISVYDIKSRVNATQRRVSSETTESTPAWIPDLIGPIFKKDDLTLRQVLSEHHYDKCTLIMATFVPDELIYAIDLTKTGFRQFNAVLLLADISGLSALYENYNNSENGGTCAFNILADTCINIIIEEICTNEGDVLKLSNEGLIALWKVHRDELTPKMVHLAVVCALRIQESLAALEGGREFISKVSIVIAAGDISFAIIGNANSRHFLVAGQPIVQLKFAKKVCLSGDLLLTKSAWEYCTSSNYEYVIKDAMNVKIVKILVSVEASRDQFSWPAGIPPRKDPFDPTIFAKQSVNVSMAYRPSVSSQIESVDSTDELIFSRRIFAGRVSMAEATRRQLGQPLQQFLMNPVIQQIEKDNPVEFLTENRRITIISLDVIPGKCSMNELIDLVDKIFHLVFNIVDRQGGCIYMVNLFERNILFHVVFGARGYVDEGPEKSSNECKNAVVSSLTILRGIKRINGFQNVYVGVATGMAFCGVIGHPVRRQYMILGLPVDRSMKLMQISARKVSCDFDTVFYSHLHRNDFRLRGVRDLRNAGKQHVYEYTGNVQTLEYPSDTWHLDYYYPILGRSQEIDMFENILDEIGVAGRLYAGFLIESFSRGGKSRVLDTLVIVARNRDLKIINLSLHESYFDKPYSVIHHITLALLDASDCKNIESRERVLLDHLGTELKTTDFCYLNVMMRVQFAMSDEYCSQSVWERHTKTLKIFNIIIKLAKRKICILLDDVQYMDYLSWQFLAHAITNVNVVIAMAIMQPGLWDDLSKVESDIRKHGKLVKHSIEGFDTELLSAFACQFLNVIGISEELHDVFAACSGGSVAWCEAFLILALQNNVFHFLAVSPEEVVNYNLIFPVASLINKIPAHFLPEDVAPPTPWMELDKFNICIVNDKFFALIKQNWDFPGLMNAIFEAMIPYEQQFIKCAAVLGVVFTRTILQDIMPDHVPDDTSQTVAEMIRIRLLQCALIQRKIYQSEELMVCMIKKRSTFADSHHLVSCHCRLSQLRANKSLPSYAYCKMLEFRVPCFRKMVYEKLSNDEKKKYHTLAAEIYEKYAHKCQACGSGPFIHIPLKRSSLQAKFKVLPSINPVINDEIEKIFVFAPAELDGKTKFLPNEKDTILESYFVDSLMDSGSSSNIYRKPVRRNKSRLLNRATVAPHLPRDPSLTKELKNFSFVDYRNCRCERLLSCVFWCLSQHIMHTGDVDKIVCFHIQYCYGFIQHGQSSFVVKVVTRFKELITDSWLHEPSGSTCFYDRIVRTLLGDAYLKLGNLSEAQRVYAKPGNLTNEAPMTKQAVCYKTIIEELRRGIGQKFTVHSHQDPLDQETTSAIELVSFLRRLIKLLMMQKKFKMAKLIALKTLRIVFVSRCSFLEKAQVYLTSMKVFRQVGDLETARRLEKPIMFVIRTKDKWQSVEEIKILAYVYLTIFQIRALRGEFAKAIKFGYKILKISDSLHLSKITITLLPTLIEILVWTKHINEAIDLMKKLYYSADEDTDMSAITWYYALCVELLLDAGIILESYETCVEYSLKVTVCKWRACVLRDSCSLTRLLTCLWTWQLRMGSKVQTLFTHSSDVYDNFRYDNFAYVFTCSKGVEAYLLTLVYCINMKKADALDDVVRDVEKILKTLHRLSLVALFVKPHLRVLKSYLATIRGRQSASVNYLQSAEKWAEYQGNKLMKAWIIQIRRTWKVAYFNNMARYWVEHVGFSDAIDWQNIHGFDLNTWSSILFPFPIPHSYL